MLSILIIIGPEAIVFPACLVLIISIMKNDHVQ